MRGAAALFVVAAAFAWLAAHGVVRLSPAAPAEQAIVVRDLPRPGSRPPPARGVGVEVRRHVERTSVGRYHGGSGP